ncbi:flagellar hook-associated protein 3 FlgL [Lysinibacillus composti]|uniref:Flagellar hook-associated protein FlgL n=1 Tax=Lysinibacillus composti TaxID=720633 RepID=A0A3N9UH46_9BACI|nr:flagellar hook-associated protein FlgL [Lysinibacillus composti]MBM7607973.1 flagellar hook-associated protein 3 FlgL [Lysinibacillus composti]RQW75434.1 flagellar hook-associated protein FlgL [Lysinibacillus composti]
MRVTQTMLSNNMLRNLSSSYSKLSKVQEQINTGKKITRPSDDPVVAMKGIQYRTELSQVEQFQRNIGEAESWLDTTDDTLDKVSSALQRTRELLVQASNGTTTDSDRESINSELKQLREHIQDLANTKIGDKYIFSGTKTTTPLYQEGKGYDLEDKAFENKVDIEVYNGITINANTTPIKMFEQIDQMFQTIDDDITNSVTDLSKHLDTMDTNMSTLSNTRAGVGARQNRVELMEDRLSTQEIIATTRVSENEDIDYEKAISEMIAQESVHRAALSVGARIIQPTLTDFLS